MTATTPARRTTAITWRIATIIARSIVTRGRVIGMVLAGVLVVVVAAVVARSSGTDAITTARVVDGLGFSLLVPASALVFGTAALGDLIDDRTLVYLWLRPVSRRSIAAGAAAAATAAATPLGVVPVTAAAWLMSHDVATTVSVGFAATFASIAAVCMFVLLGSLSQRALSWGIGYVLIYEQFIARGGSGLGFFSVHAHAVSIVARRLDVDLDLDYFSAGTSVIALGVVAVGAVTATTWRMRRLEVA